MEHSTLLFLLHPLHLLCSFSLALQAHLGSCSLCLPRASVTCIGSQGGGGTHAGLVPLFVLQHLQLRRNPVCCDVDSGQLTPILCTFCQEKHISALLNQSLLAPATLDAPTICYSLETCRRAPRLCPEPLC